MASGWVRIYTAILDDLDLSRLGLLQPYVVLIVLAGKCDYAGKLTTRIGPMTVPDLSRTLQMNLARTKSILDALIGAGFMAIDKDGCYEILGFDRWQQAKDKTSAARQRVHRQKRMNELEALRNGRNVTLFTSVTNGEDNGVTNGVSDRQIYRDIEIQSTSLTSFETRDPDDLKAEALAFATWPADVDGLKALARLFLAAFGHTRDPSKAAKHLPPYTQILGQFRSRNVTILEAWQACADAVESLGGKPLFGPAVKTAMSFLKPREATVRRYAGPNRGGFHEVVLPPEYDPSEPIR